MFGTTRCSFSEAEIRSNRIPTAKTLENQSNNKIEGKNSKWVVSLYVNVFGGMDG